MTTATTDAPAPVDDGTPDRIVARLRDLTAAGLAGVVSGVIFGGLGGRLVMRVSALLDPTATGLRTEGGNRIGEFTLEGSVGLLLFGGVFSGLFASVVWVAVRQWLPSSSSGRYVVAGVAGLTLGGVGLVQASNHDFFILDPGGANVVMFLAIPVAIALSIVRLDKAFGARLPTRRGALALYVPAVALGALFTVPALGSYLDSEFCFCDSPPRPAGIFLAAAAGASIAYWIAVVTRRTEPPPALLETAGRAATFGAVVTAGVHLIGQIRQII